MSYEAVAFDLGGVVLGSPFPAMRRYERDLGLADRALVDVVRLRGEDGAWYRHERGELGFREFCRVFESEGAELGIVFSAAELMRRIAAAVQPDPGMVAAVDAIRAAGLRTAALTNNWATPAPAGDTFDGLQSHFDVFLESHVLGLRKPDPAIYEVLLDRLGSPAQAVIYLDDMGRNLKPARALGMTTIKVEAQAAAIAELERLLGLALS